MPNAYNNRDAAKAFDAFLNSENGKIQRQILQETLVPYLSDKNGKILDAACGQGWLAAQLQRQFPQIEAFDSAENLIEEARQAHPAINFRVADVTQPLPYSQNYFDYVILNMAAHDIDNLAAAFNQLYQVLKPGGTFLMTVANPYYGYPVGVWKRGALGVLLRKKPALKLRPYHDFRRKPGKLHDWQNGLASYFYPLSEYLNCALQTGFNLKEFHDLYLSSDSKTFNAQYQLYRFPIILLLVFKKSAE